MTLAKALQRAGYQLEYDVGYWTFGTLQVVRSAKGTWIVCKAARKGHQQEIERKGLERLKALRHPRIITLYDVLEDDDNWYLLTEYCEGGDIGELLERLADRAWLDERTCALYTRQLLEAVAHGHANKICHGDLHTGSLVLTSRLPDASVKVADFGVASVLDPHHTHARRQPTTFTAPEVLLGREGISGAVGQHNPAAEQSDMWSVGAICYNMLVSSMPFSHATRDDMSAADLAKTMSGSLHFFEDDGWDERSQACRDFLRRALRYDPGERIPAQRAMHNQWISSLAPSGGNKGMRGASEADRMREPLQKALTVSLALIIAPVVVPEQTLKYLHKAFLHHDREQSGKVSRDMAEGALGRVTGGTPTIVSRALDITDVHGKGDFDMCSFVVAHVLAIHFGKIVESGGGWPLVMNMQARIFELYEGQRSPHVQFGTLHDRLCSPEAKEMESFTNVSYIELIGPLYVNRVMDPATFLQGLLRAGGRGTPVALPNCDDHFSEKDLDGMCALKMEENGFQACATEVSCNSHSGKNGIPWLCGL